jgi:hypothetical protein
VGNAKHNGPSSAKVCGINSENAGYVEKGKKPPIKSSGAGIAGCGDDVADTGRTERRTKRRVGDGLEKPEDSLQEWPESAGRLERGGPDVAYAARECRDRPVPSRRRGTRPAERGDVEHAGGAGREEFNVSRIAREEGLPGWGSDANGEYQRGTIKRRVGEQINGLPGWLAEPVNAWECDWDSIPRIVTGEPDRVNKLKALGNAVVPQAFYPVFAAIAEIERRGLSPAAACNMNKNAP